jgi:hypothetical protein
MGAEESRNVQNRNPTAPTVASHYADGSVLGNVFLLGLFTTGRELLNKSVSWVHNPYRSAPGIHSSAATSQTQS